MNDRPRYLFDANVIVSALLFEDCTPGRAFYQAVDRGDILLSNAVAQELGDVLAREKFDAYLTREERDSFLVMLIRRAKVIETGDVPSVSRDPRDDKYLALALGGGAKCIVTGDQDLLVLREHQGIPILTPAQFLEFLERP